LRGIGWIAGKPLEKCRDYDILFLDEKEKKVVKSKTDEPGPSTSKEKEGSAPPSDEKKTDVAVVVAETVDEAEKPTELRSEPSTDSAKTESSPADAVKDVAKEEPMDAN
jgi:hypothetical protein